MSDGGEGEWKARILVNMNWTFLVEELNESTSKVIFLIQQKLSEEELALPFDGVLYLPPDGLRNFSTEELDEEVERFEKFVSFVGGIEGKCLAIWVDAHDQDMKDTMGEKLHLKERNCEWFWDYIDDDESDEDIILESVNFLKRRLNNNVNSNQQKDDFY